MPPERWQRCTDIFNLAVEQPADERAAFVERSCDGDQTLRRKVELLLKHHDASGDFIKSPAFEAAPELLAGDPDGLIGQHLGCYRVNAVAGVGGMGVVYLAWDERLDRNVALKLLPQSMVANEAALKRLKHEARTASALNHPNIVTIHDIGEVDSNYYVATEYIEGSTLRERITRGPIPPNEAVDIAAQVASALAAAHDAGVVHRDIKPENIMIRPDGYVKVLDFGIAKLAEQKLPVTTPKDEALLLVETNLGSILGTARYMSPEQARGAPVDKRTDIWSLGVVLYEMMTGHTPFTGNTPAEVMSAILDKEALPLVNYIAHAPAELQQIISKTLRKDRGQRYQSAHELLQSLKNFRRKLEFEAELQHATAAPSWRRWARSPAAVTFLLLIAALTVLPFYWYRNVATRLPVEKSLAVLPLANLSDDKDNAFFADGVHDELLSNLSKIRDLKVISRTSVMNYKSGNPRNLREIGQQLGVAHVLEGSVQRIGNRVKVSAQLMDARSDAHLWGQTYDRDFTDVFAIQSEIARTIADQLQAKLSPAEKAAIAERPTADPVAYALYTKANAMDLNDWEGGERGLNQMILLLEKATQRDPNFALAYCKLVAAHQGLYHSFWDPKHLELAKKAAETAMRLRPDLGETHLALAEYYSSSAFSPAGGTVGGVQSGSFDRAREELAIARLKLPNNARPIFLTAWLDRRQNRWDSALANFQKAHELDPRDSAHASYLGITYFELRRYKELEQFMKKCADNGLLESSWAQLWIARMKLAQGEPVVAQSVLEQVPLDYSSNPFIWITRFDAALYLRDYDAADRVIAATPAKWADSALDGQHGKSWADGLIARLCGDKEKALAVFAAWRKKWDERWGDKPHDEAYFERAARVDAGLGRKEDAIREALHAVELMPIAKDISGPLYVITLAQVYAWTGERDRALEQLEFVATIPNGVTYGDLHFNPCWDSLRGDPRFDKIVAAAKAASK